MTLEELFRAYSEQVKPLLILVEARLEKFPIGILNEVRATHDHIARTFEPSAKPEDRVKEIESAARHIQRTMLDAYKVLCADSQMRMETFRRDYRGVRLGEVDSGRFLPKLTELQRIAVTAVETAKLSEKSGSRNSDETLTRFEQALAAWDDVNLFVRDQAQNLAWAASHQRRGAWKDRLIGAAIGFIIGLLVRMVGKHFGI